MVAKETISINKRSPGQSEFYFTAVVHEYSSYLLTLYIYGTEVS